MSKKSWKDHLLSSGVPLEYSVGRIFQDLVGDQPSEFTYERDDADGIRKVFSVDVQSSQMDTTRNFWLEVLVECKYRHDGTQWVFTPQQYEPLLGVDFNDAFVILDHCCIDRNIDRNVIAKFRGQYPLCGKGIELLPDSANPKSIEQAIRQLRHAVVAKALDALEHQVDELLGNPTPLFVIAPIIVTTAELWRLKPGTTVEDVRRAEKIDLVADAHDILVVHQRPDNLDEKESMQAILNSFQEDRRLELESRLKRTSGISPRLFAQHFGRYNPSLFVVIRYERFRAAASNLLRFFAQADMIKQRTPR